MKSIMITGHRRGPRVDFPYCLAGMTELLGELKDKYDDIFAISGGADGCDRFWARSAWIKGVPFDIYVPRGYSDYYGLGEWWNYMLSQAHEIHWTQDKGVDFYPRLNLIRNEQMVEAADIYVIASNKDPLELIKEKKGGTAHCARLIVGKFPYWHLDSLTGALKHYSKESQLEFEL